MRVAYEGGGDAAAPPVDAASEREEKKRLFLEAMKKKRGAALEGVKVFKPAASTGRARIPAALEEGTGEFAGIDEFIGQLPGNYSFEVKKCVNRILETKARVVALQMPGKSFACRGRGS